MKKNMRKKALLPALSMLLASVIALSGVTYAWFTTGNTAQVTKLDVNVQTANGIQVSLDAQAWRSIITADDIKASAANPAYTTIVNQYPIGEIAPVSTAGEIEDGKMKMFLGEISQDGTLRSQREVEEARTSAGNFIAFDLYFKSSSTQMLTLDIGDSQSYVKGASIEGSQEDAGTERAVRVAFIPLGNKTTPAEARALKGDATTAAKIWEPNAYTRAAGIEPAGTKEAYKGFKAEFEGKAEEELSDAEVASVETFTTSEQIVELKQGITKVRVYIWLEGQDIDCVNQISFGDFTANLSFSVPEIVDEG